MMNSVLDWLADKLIRDEHVEDGPELDRAECQDLLKLISERAKDTYLLIVNMNIESDGIYYDYILDKNKENKVIVEE